MEQIKLEFRDYSMNEEQIISIVSNYLKLDDLNYVIKNKGNKQYIYCFYYNGDVLKLNEKDYNNIINKIRVNESIENNKLNHLVSSIMPDIIQSIMQIKPINDNCFHYRHKENIEQIENYELPKHRLMKEDKFNLVNMIMNTDFDLSTYEINDCLVHNQMPYSNYKKLQDNLALYYENINKENIHKYVYDNEEDACLDVIESIHKNYSTPLLLKEADKHIVYSKTPLKHEDMRTNKNIRAYDFLNPEEDDTDKHHCFHLFKDDKIKKTKINITEKIKIHINYTIQNYVNIQIYYEGKKLEIDNFYLNDDEEMFLEKVIEKAWSRGVFLNSFGKEYYKDKHIILKESLCVPEWFSSTNGQEFQKLINRIEDL